MRLVVDFFIVQVSKFSNAVDSLGSKTLASIARAGPNTKVGWCMSSV